MPRGKARKLITDRAVFAQAPIRLRCALILMLCLEMRSVILCDLCVILVYLRVTINCKYGLWCLCFHSFMSVCDIFVLRNESKIFEYVESCNFFYMSKQ